MKKKGIANKILFVLLGVLVVGFVTAQLVGVEFRAVVSGSMEPERPVGSLVIAFPKAYEDIQVGDDVVYLLNKKEGNVVTHRVIEKQDDDQRLVTKGIANDNPDGAISYDRVLGVVKTDIPYLGYPFILLESKSAKIVFSIVVIAVILVLLVLSYPDKDKETAADGEALALPEFDLMLDERFQVD